MSAAPSLGDLALRIDELLLQPGNMAVARALTESYLAGRLQETIPAIPFPAHSDEPIDEDDVALIAEQAVATATALHDVYCRGVEKVVAIPSELPHLDDDTTYRDPECVRVRRRAMKWAATLRQVQGLGEYARAWFTLMFRRFELVIASTPAVLRPTGAARRRMSAEEANEAAMRLVHEHGQVFFALSETEQARRIGCHLNTWRKTPLYKKAAKRRERGKSNARSASQPARAAVSFTSSIEATVGTGAPDDQMNRLIHEEEEQKKMKQDRQQHAQELQQALADYARDFEPSPLDEDPPDGRPKRVTHRKRV
jgi:hypothetical protein